jgi:hypothetical protein
MQVSILESYGFSEVSIFSFGKFVKQKNGLKLKYERREFMLEVVKMSEKRTISIEGLGIGFHIFRRAIRKSARSQGQTFPIFAGKPFGE